MFWYKSLTELPSKTNAQWICATCKCGNGNIRYTSANKNWVSSSHVLGWNSFSLPTKIQTRTSDWLLNQTQNSQFSQNQTHSVRFEHWPTHIFYYIAETSLVTWSTSSRKQVAPKWITVFYAGHRSLFSLSMINFRTTSFIFNIPHGVDWRWLPSRRPKLLDNRFDASRMTAPQSQSTYSISTDSDAENGQVNILSLLTL